MTLKYQNKPCSIDGENYRSKREANRHQELRLLEKVGAITGLKREVPYVLAPSVKIQGRTRPALRYVADFTYLDYTPRPDGQFVVEDCKGFRTEGYRIKRHLMAAIHNIEILET